MKKGVLISFFIMLDVGRKWLHERKTSLRECLSENKKKKFIGWKNHIQYV